MAFRIEVSGEWAGSVGGWRPAIAGALNATGRSDEKASTFETREEADDVLEYDCLSQQTGGDQNAPEFRVVEVAS